MNPNPTTKKSSLLVVDTESWASVRTEVLDLIEISTPEQNIDVLAFVDDWSEVLESDIRGRAKHEVRVIRGAKLINQVAVGAREELTEFISILRERLVGLAFASGGKNWGKRFSKLWWYSRVSQKNSALEAVWWSYFRFKAVCLRMSEWPYGRCLVAGDQELCDFLEGHCSRLSIDFSARPGFKPKRVLKTVMIRVYAGIGLALTILLTKMTLLPKESWRASAKKILLAFSWPEFWSERFGVWEDMYYGCSIKCAEANHGADGVYALGLYGRAVMKWAELKEQFLRLKDPRWHKQKYLVLEHYGSALRVLGEYFSWKDIFCFARMARAPQYRNIFVWRDIDFSKLFSPMLWESALVLWPYLISQERMSARLVQSLSPEATVFYSFEFLAGKAWLTGIKQSTRKMVIAMQHGPMTPMKLTYAGTPAEDRSTADGGVPRPSADVYIVDGALSQDILLQAGIAGKKIKIAGGARFDESWKRAVRSRLTPRFSGGAIRVLVAPTMHDPEFVLQCVLSALGDRSDVALMFKPHPKSSIEAMNSLVAKCVAQNILQCSLSVVVEKDIYSLMDESDIIVGTYSSTIVEAIVFGVSPVLLVSHRKADLTPFFGMDEPGVLRAESPESLKNCIERLIKDEPFRQSNLAEQGKIVARVFGPVDGDSGKGVADILCSGFIQGERNGLEK